MFGWRYDLEKYKITNTGNGFFVFREFERHGLSAGGLAGGRERTETDRDGLTRLPSEKGSPRRPRDDRLPTAPTGTRRAAPAPGRRLPLATTSLRPPLPIRPPIRPQVWRARPSASPGVKGKREISKTIIIFMLKPRNPFTPVSARRSFGAGRARLTFIIKFR